MIEIKTSNLNQENASFKFNSDIKINEEKRNLLLFDIKNNLDDIKSSFGKIISGINKSKAVYYNDTLAFDNELYFNSRIYIDTKYKYINTLSEEKISNMIIGEYGKAFDDKYFKKLVHDLTIRSHYKKGKFDAEGLTLSGISIALSTFSNSIININDVNSLKKALSFKQDFLYGLTVLTKYNNDSIDSSFTNYFDNIYFVNEDNGISITKINKQALNTFGAKEANYEK